MLELKSFGEQTDFGDRLDGVWSITYRLGYTADGKLGIRELTIKPFVRAPRLTGDDDEDLRELRAIGGNRPIPGGGITTALLRRIRIGEELRYGRACIRTQRHDPPVKRQHENRGRPRVLSNAFYRKVARRYRQLNQQRVPHPAKTIASEFGYTRKGMGSVLDRCRQKGLLSR
jgi:hypothetical protein